MWAVISAEQYGVVMQRLQVCGHSAWVTVLWIQVFAVTDFIHANIAKEMDRRYSDKIFPSLSLSAHLSAR